jgi:glycine/D-amino acid oxidase-like deaminating enzyme
MAKVYDAIIVGGGFFGLNIASYLRTELGQKNILVLEKETDFMQRASYNNQARVHGGYHYPRSLLTGLRSQINFPRFTKDYKRAIVSDFDKYYALANNFSKISARQFKLFCDRIGAEVETAPADIKQLFNNDLIEQVFKVREYAFNSDILKQDLVNKLHKEGVELRPVAVVQNVQPGKAALHVETEGGLSYDTRAVFNCAYSLINIINENSKLPILPLKHELTEISLVKLPAELEGKSVTVMCGPFFSFMPFPARDKLHTLSHVRYTPHSEWTDHPTSNRNGHDYLSGIDRVSQYRQMVSDAARYLPSINKAKYDSSLWEIKTVLQQSERDDSRPILFRRDHGLKGYHCIMGGKLDNIYDVFRELDVMYGKI